MRPNYVARAVKAVFNYPEVVRRQKAREAKGSDWDNDTSMER